MEAEKYVCQVTTKITRKRTEEGKLLNQYLVMKRIGEGPHARIKLARDTSNGSLVAIKKFAMYLLKKKTRPVKQPDGKIRHLCITEDIKREVEIAASVNHPSVVKLLEILDDQENGKLYLVMEYCQNGETASWNSKKHHFQVKPQFLEPKKLKGLCLDMIRGLKYLHQSNIIHRDLKPQNILVDSAGKAKIIDFGRAAKLSSPQQRLKGSEGTYHFMAPQSLQEFDKNGYVGQICDIWSLGVSIYCMYFKKLPFDADPILKLFQKIENADFKYPQGVEILPFVKKIIDGTLVKDPAKRLSLNDIEKILQE